MAEKVSLSEWNVPLKNGGDDLLQKYDYFSFLRKDFPLKVILSAGLKSLSKIDSV